MPMHVHLDMRIRVLRDIHTYLDTGPRTSLYTGVRAYLDARKHRCLYARDPRAHMSINIYMYT